MTAVTLRITGTGDIPPFVRRHLLDAEGQAGEIAQSVGLFGYRHLERPASFAAVILIGCF